MQRGIKLFLQSRILAGRRPGVSAGLFPFLRDFFTFTPPGFQSLVDPLAKLLERFDGLGLHVKPRLFGGVLRLCLVGPVHLPQAEQDQRDKENYNAERIFHCLPPAGFAHIYMDKVFVTVAYAGKPGFDRRQDKSRLFRLGAMAIEGDGSQMH